jgi:very-short-patch-repair endonuclease
MDSKYRTSLNKIEQAVFNILTRLDVKFEAQVEIGKYNVDFLVDGIYIIECYGDFWHCNPNKYGPEYFNRSKKKCAQDIWDRDSERKFVFEQQGYKFLNLWETEINNHPKKVKNKIKRFLGRRKE